MPIYEYRCQACHHEMEVMQKISEDALKQCPACGKDSLAKLISRSSFQLKGTGWYQTDFKNSPAKSENKTETNTDAKTETKSEAKSESKTTTTSTSSSSETK